MNTTSCSNQTLLRNLQETPKTSANYADLSPTTSAGFECSICLDAASDPVVTLCGHLYCWPCLAKWLPKSSQCPICKASISENTVVPIYGHGGAYSKGTARPQAPRVEMYDRGGYEMEWTSSNTVSVMNSTAGCVLARLSGCAGRPYQLEMGGAHARVEESLSQIWVFLLCATILCLIFF